MAPVSLWRSQVALALLILALAPFGGLAQPSWPNVCGDGRVDAILDDFDTTAGEIYKAHPEAIAAPTLGQDPGCHGSGLALGYDRLALRGSNPNSRNAVDVKLRDSFPEAAPTFNLYAQAEALLVLISEYEHTHDEAYRDAARALASLWPWPQPGRTRCLCPSSTSPPPSPRAPPARRT